MRVARLLLVLTVAAGLAAPTAGAQQVSVPVNPYRMMVAINPLGIPWDIFSAEIESGVGRGVTLGAAGSYTAIDDGGRRFTTLDIKGRYYPGERWFNNLSTGMSLGVTRFSYRQFYFDPQRNTSGDSLATLTAPTLGLLLDYNWVHGSSRRFIVGFGIGAKRVLAAKEERAQVDVPRAFPTGRFVIGWAY